MLSTAHRTDVVVIGAGLAGLAAARRLTGGGMTVTVVEAEARPGGRMATGLVDGFRLDRGLHLLNTAAPGLHGVPGLRLLPFASTTVRADGLGRARAALDKARLGVALGRLAVTPVERLLARPETTTAEALVTRGYAPRSVDGFLRPLLSVLLSDPSLSTSSRCGDLVLRGYARGRPALALGGAAALPRWLAASLPPGTLRFGARAVTASTTSVTLEDGTEIPCRAVVVATGARAAGELLPGLRVPAFQPVTVFHHAAPEEPGREAALIIASDRNGPVSHTFPASRVDPSLAPAGRTLITSVVLGPPPGPDPDKTVRTHLAELYETATEEWEPLAVHHDPEAVPLMTAPHDLRRPVRMLAGLYVCGDHRGTSTPQGALHSGHRAAVHALRDFGAGRPGTERAAAA